MLHSRRLTNTQSIRQVLGQMGYPRILLLASAPIHDQNHNKWHD
ncbi:hypothetical protein VCR31J2_100004 [Vibrio coralliirubri]|uniref:Uncharacterized protein n=1 Tax=Vibrio coralliirubri TaxID=1516159 RepID=A0AA87BZY7_9VIBR|nr:hypothetical protein VCR31J2_100004 [Vibrio coralliirubri]